MDGTQKTTWIPLHFLERENLGPEVVERTSNTQESAWQMQVGRFDKPPSAVRSAFPDGEVLLDASDVRGDSELPYFGSRLDLRTPGEVRYTGTLYAVDPITSAIYLRDARCCGTEGRPCTREVLPSSHVVHFIRFLRSELTDLRVVDLKGAPPREQDEGESDHANNPEPLAEDDSPEEDIPTSAKEGADLRDMAPLQPPQPSPVAELQPSGQESNQMMRREGFGECFDCGEVGQGEYDDDGDGDALYCTQCWVAFEEFGEVDDEKFVWNDANDEGESYAEAEGGPGAVATTSVAASIAARATEEAQLAQEAWQQHSAWDEEDPMLNEETVMLVREWQQARRRKDFEVADTIRAELRAQGIEAEAAAEELKEAAEAAAAQASAAEAAENTAMQRAGGRRAGRDPDAELNDEEMGKVQEWQQARRRKDFETADRLRTELRAQGIEAEAEAAQLPPPPRAENAGRRIGQDTASKDLQQMSEEEVEVVQEWMQARRGKDWETADAIRAMLRGLGIAADQAAAQLAERRGTGFGREREGGSAPREPRELTSDDLEVVQEW